MQEAAAFPAELVGRRIVMTRTWRGMKQAELAAVVGIASNSLVSIEKGRTVPGADRIWSMAKALRIRPDYLLGSTDQMELDEQ